MPWWMAYVARDTSGEKADRARRARLHKAAVERRKKQKRGGKK